LTILDVTQYLAPGRITILSWKPTTYQCPKGFSLTNGLTMSWN
jgi:hypothetical protein